MVQALSRLLDVKLEYDWTPLNWYVNPDLPDNVINQQPSSVIADLMGAMEHIITEGEEEAYQSEIQYRNAQSEFKRFIKSAEGWRKLEFISSILGMIALVALIVRGCAGTAGNLVQVGNTAFMRFMKCQLHVIAMLLYPHKLLIILYYLDNICWWRCQRRLIRNTSIVCYPLAPELSAKNF